MIESDGGLRGVLGSYEDWWGVMGSTVEIVRIDEQLRVVLGI